MMTISRSAAALVFEGRDTVNSIAEHLANGGKVDLRCPQTQQSLIHWLLQYLDMSLLDCSLKMLKRLLALGVDADARDDGSITALMMTCDPVYIEHCKALLDAGANVDLARHHVGEQAIHIAFFRGLKAHIKLLIDAGADINALADSKIDPSNFSMLTGEGGTCLMRAASQQSRAVPYAICCWC
jgi:Ankyrin repeats (3 copies)